MTEREEQAIIVLNTLYNNPLLSDIHRQALEVGIKAIKAQSSSENPNKWIPCSERLPEVGSQVIVCYEFKGKRSVFIADFYGDGEFHGLDDEYLTTEARKHRKAIAWMPMPTPPKMSEIPTDQIVTNGELYPGEFDDPLAEEGSDKE